MLDVYLVCIFFILVISKWHTNFSGASHLFYKGEFESDGVLGRMEDFIGNKI